MKKFLKGTVATTILATVALTSCGDKTTTTTEPIEGDGTTVEQQEETTEETGQVNTITGKELMSNVNARKAISMAYDKTYITDVILNNGSTAIDGLVPVGFVMSPEGNDFREDGGDYNVYDVEMAKEYWAMAKEELGFETVEVTLTNFDSDSAKKTGEFLKSELEQNLDGLTFSIKQIPFQQKLEAVRAGDFDISYGGWGPDYLDPATFTDMYLTGSGYNYPGYSNATYDELAKTDASDPQLRWDNLVEAERMLIEDDAVISPVFQRQFTRLYKPEVSGIVSHDFGPDYSYQWVELDRDDKVLKILETAKAPTLDINLATDARSFEILNNMYEGLVSLGQEGSNVIPAIAEDWDVDGLTYTFNLRDDATYVNHLGEVVGHVTAHDFVFSWDRLVNPETAAQYGDMLTDVANIESYEALNDYTFQVTLAKETPWFESLMTFPVFYPINEEIFNQYGDSFGTTLETTVSSGPFYLSTWNFNERAVLTKNPHYFAADDVKIDGVNIRVIEGADNETLVSMYFADELDRVGLSGENVELYQDHEDAVLEPSPTVFYLEFNVNNNK